MKKYTLLCAALCAAMLFTGCKSSESAYKQAYLKAKQQEELQQKQEAEAQAAAAKQEAENNVVVPMEEKPVTQTQVVDNADRFCCCRCWSEELQRCCWFILSEG